MFSFFKRKADNVPASEPSKSADIPNNFNIDVPESIFIEKDESVQNQKIENTIELLFDFLDKNHEAKGYDDALVNPDIKHLEQNKEALKNQLERTIRRVKTFYEDFIREIDFHLESRTRSGMVDIVDELQMKKDIAESHIQKVLNIEEETRKNIGDSQGIIISYSRGFMNGLSAISHQTILKRF